MALSQLHQFSTYQLRVILHGRSYSKLNFENVHLRTLVSMAATADLHSFRQDASRLVKHFEIIVCIGQSEQNLSRALVLAGLILDTAGLCCLISRHLGSLRVEGASDGEGLFY